MSDWIYLRVDPEKLERVEELEGDAKIRYSPSPYDIPEAARADFDETKKRLRIQFKYINEEPVRRTGDKAAITFGMGRNSQRLYEITVDMGKVGEVVKQSLHNLASFIEKEIKGLATEDAERRSNYALVEQAIDDKKQSLLSEATAETRTAVES